MMKVYGGPKYVDFELGESETLRTTKETIMKQCDLLSHGSSDSVYFKIEKGNLIRIDVWIGNHCSDTETILRKATELDKAAVLILEKLDNFKRH
jgi:hypothetical protein